MERLRCLRAKIRGKRACLQAARAEEESKLMGSDHHDEHHSGLNHPGFQGPEGGACARRRNGAGRLAFPQRTASFFRG